MYTIHSIKETIICDAVAHLRWKMEHLWLPVQRELQHVDERMDCALGPSQDEKERK
jgi:hypothetical protein